MGCTRSFDRLHRARRSQVGHPEDLPAAGEGVSGHGGQPRGDLAVEGVRASEALGTTAEARTHASGERRGIYHR